MSTENVDARPLTEDEIRKLILAASTDYERYTARVISRQRKEITALEEENRFLRGVFQDLTGLPFRGVPPPSEKGD